MKDTKTPEERLREAQDKLARGEPVKVFQVHSEPTPDGPITTKWETLLVVCPYCQQPFLLRDASKRRVDFAKHVADCHVEE